MHLYCYSVKLFEGLYFAQRGFLFYVDPLETTKQSTARARIYLDYNSISTTQFIFCLFEDARMRVMEDRGRGDLLH